MPLRRATRTSVWDLRTWVTGQYDKATDLLSKGLTKGGVKSEPEAHLLLGIAQLKGGHKDDAVKSFHAVKGDPTLERLANLWTPARKAGLKKTRFHIFPPQFVLMIRKGPHSFSYMLNSRILLIEDDARLRELLRSYLTKYGFLLSILETGEQAMEVVSRDGVALVLLDVDLPGESGLAVCSRLRAAGCALPIIMITARSDLEDQILGLEMGADDYMVKPFEPRELLARIGARLRRQALHVRPSGSGRDAPPLRFGPFEFDSARQALSRSGEQLVLTRAELAIFEIFARHPRQVLARERICELTRRSVATSTRSIDVQIARLRRLLEKDTGNPRYIRTIWGVGYAFYPETAGAGVPGAGMAHTDQLPPASL